MNPRNKQTTSLTVQLRKETDAKDDKQSTGKSVCKRCGLDTHSLPTHDLCPYKKMHHPSGSNYNKGAKKKDKDSDTDSDGQANSPMTDVESYGDHVNYQLPDEHDVVMPEDDAISGCNCDTLGRAHSRKCPMNPRNKQTTSLKVQLKGKEATVGTEKKNVCPYNKRLHTSGSSDNKAAENRTRMMDRANSRPGTLCTYTILAHLDNISFVEQLKSTATGSCSTAGEAHLQEDSERASLVLLTWQLTLQS